MTNPHPHGPRPRAHARRTTAPGRAVLRAEPLEDRTTPATLFVPTDRAGGPGEVVTVPVRLTVTEPSINLASADIALSFDPALFDAGNVVAGPGLTGFTPTSVVDNPNGTIEFTATSPANVVLTTGTYTLFTVDLTVAPGAAPGTSPIDVEATAGTTTTELADLAGTAVALAPAPTNAPTDANVDGQLTVTAGPAGPTVSTLTPTITSPRRDPADDVVTVTFSGPVDAATFTTNDLSLTRNGAAVGVSGLTIAPTANPAVFTVTGLAALTGLEGDYVLTVGGAGVTAAGGAAGSGTATQSFTVDTTAPAVTGLSAVTPDPRNTPVDTITLTAAPDVSLASLADADVVLTRGGVAVPLTGLTFTAGANPGEVVIGGLTPFTGAAGAYELTVSGASLTDLAGNVGTGTATRTFTVDLTGPAVTAVGQPAANGDVVVTFDQPVDLATLSAADLTLTRNGTPVTLTGLTFAAGAAPGQVVVGGLAPLIAGPGDYVLTAAGAGVNDPVGNPGSGTAESKFTVITAAIATAATGPTNADTLTFNVTFSEDVAGVDAADFTVNQTGGTGTPAVTGVTGTGSAYQVTVAVPAGADTDFALGFAPGGSVTGVANGAVVPAGATSPAVSADRLGPVGKITQASGQADPAGSGKAVAFTVTFDEDVTGFTAADVTVSGVPGATVQSVTGSGSTYTVTVGGFTGVGTVTAALAAGAATDAAGNTSTTDATGDAAVTLRAAADNLVTISSGGGTAQTYRVGSDGTLTTVGNPAAPFAGFTGSVRSTTADVNGDGTPDTVFVTGPGTPIRFTVVSGASGNAVLVPPTAPFSGSEGFTGGGFVAAADLDGDGRAEMAFTPDQGGGPRVTIFSLVGGDALAVRANFLGITGDDNFRGGARPALGDVNGDGTPDLAVAAGFLGGPRVALFDGKSLLGGNPQKLVNDFFAFNGADVDTLRDGAYVAIGDLTGDGRGDLIFGGGPNGGARVFALSGALVAAGKIADAYAAPVANFFVGGDSTSRGGVRVGAADADGDGRADLLAGSGAGSPARVRVYLGKDFAGAGEPAAYQDLAPFGGAALPDGVYVG